MCDKEAFHRLEDRVDNLELKQCKCETATAAKFEAFEKTTKLLITGFKWVFVSPALWSIWATGLLWIS